MHQSPLSQITGKYAQNFTSQNMNSFKSIKNIYWMQWSAFGLGLDMHLNIPPEVLSRSYSMTLSSNRTFFE